MWQYVSEFFIFVERPLLMASQQTLLSGAVPTCVRPTVLWNLVRNEWKETGLYVFQSIPKELSSDNASNIFPMRLVVYPHGSCGGGGGESPLSQVVKFCILSAVSKSFATPTLSRSPLPLLKSREEEMRQGSLYFYATDDYSYRHTNRLSPSQVCSLGGLSIMQQGDIDLKFGLTIWNSGLDQV